MGTLETSNDLQQPSKPPTKKKDICRMAGHFVASLLAFVPHSPPTQCTVFRKKEREKNMYCLSLKFAVF